MSYTELALTIVFGWSLIGLATAYVMARRGHDPFSWWLIGTMFGPLTVIYVLDRFRLDRNRIYRPIFQPRARGEGPVDVLIGIDGSPEADAAVATVAAILGPRIGRLTLATVLPYDTPVWSPIRREASVALELAGPRSINEEAEKVLLEGPPADELVRYANSEGFQLLAVGNRGKGLSTAFLGSVASRLARADGVPTLIVGPGQTSSIVHGRVTDCEKAGEIEAAATASAFSVASSKMGGEAPDMQQDRAFAPWPSRSGTNTLLSRSRSHALPRREDQ
jgi:nucleotide-binding universal stress UspA family protein